MSPLLITIIVIAGIIAVTAVMMLIQNKKNKHELKSALKKSWGKKQGSRYSSEELKSIAAFFNDTKGDIFCIDDTTWNDLGMNRVFADADAAVSSPGSDILYKMLRVPSFDDAELKERDRLMEFFSDNTEIRERVQECLLEINNSGRTSLYSKIKTLDNAKPIRTGKYIALLILAIVNIILLFIQPVAAVVMFIIMVSFDLSIHIRNNADINRYIIGFSGVLSMICTASKIYALNIPELKTYDKNLKEVTAKLVNMKRGSGIVLASGNAGTGIGAALMQYVNIFFHFDMLKYNQMLDEYNKNRDACMSLFECLGFLDAMIAAASFRKALPFYCKPLMAEAESIEFNELYHIHCADPVPNSAKLEGGILVTGSNASGKSTFLKSAGIACVLAQSIYTVPAKEFKAPFVRMMSSMAISDNLEAKESYFVAELKSIKRIIDEAKNGGKVFGIVDEVLRGTNTLERIAASAEVLREIKDAGAIILAATHDNELTYILEDDFRNVHFEEKIYEDDIHFDYLLKEGRATSRNALALMRLLKYDAETVDSAEKLIGVYEETGKWKETQ